MLDEACRFPLELSEHSHFFPQFAAFFICPHPPSISSLSLYSSCARLFDLLEIPKGQLPLQPCFCSVRTFESNVRVHTRILVSTTCTIRISPSHFISRLKPPKVTSTIERMSGETPLSPRKRTPTVTSPLSSFAKAHQPNAKRAHKVTSNGPSTPTPLSPLSPIPIIGPPPRTVSRLVLSFGVVIAFLIVLFVVEVTAVVTAQNSPAAVEDAAAAGDNAARLSAPPKTAGADTLHPNGIG